jgi:hypothetical protein
MQGRLNSIFGLLPFGLQSVSVPLAGALVQAAGPAAALLVFAGCLLGLALSASLHRPLRRVPMSAFMLNAPDAQGR